MTGTSEQAPVLPDFNDRDDHRKGRPIQDRDVKNFCSAHRYLPHIDRYAKARGIPTREVRILDMGCGRGLLVAFLRSRGYRAYGVDISEDYVRTGHEYFSCRQMGDAILSLVDSDSRTSFEDGFFDIVISDQVLEHVEHLSNMAEEITRLLKPEGITLHYLPPRWRLIEPHLGLPIVHWLPKTRLRRAAIRLFLTLGLGKNYFADYSVSDRAQIFHDYSVSNTFYRSNAEIARCFEKTGLCCDINRTSQDHLRDRFPWLANTTLSIPLFNALLIRAYSSCWSLCIACHR